MHTPAITDTTPHRIGNYLIDLPQIFGRPVLSNMELFFKSDLPPQMLECIPDAASIRIKFAVRDASLPGFSALAIDSRHRQLERLAATDRSKFRFSVNNASDRPGTTVFRKTRRCEAGLSERMSEMHLPFGDRHVIPESAPEYLPSPLLEASSDNQYSSRAELRLGYFAHQMERMDDQFMLAETVCMDGMVLRIAEDMPFLGAAVTVEFQHRREDGSQLTLELRTPGSYGYKQPGGPDGDLPPAFAQMLGDAPWKRLLRQSPRHVAGVLAPEWVAESYDRQKRISRFLLEIQNMHATRETAETADRAAISLLLEVHAPDVDVCPPPEALEAVVQNWDGWLTSLRQAPFPRAATG